MKKAFTAIAVLALTIGAASALSFQWGTSAKISFNGTQLTTAALAAPATVELIYLGTDKAWSFDESGLVTDEVVSTGSVTVTGGAANKGKGNGKFDGKLLGEAFADKSTFGNGNVFGVLITYTDANGDVWYNLSSNTYTLANAADDGSVIPKQTFAFAWTNDESGAEAPTAGGGWWTVPVPEPVSAGLALAGIALLLKRRRA